MRRGVILTAALFLTLVFAPRASAQIAVDNVTPNPGPNANVNSLTWAHTVGSGSNRILIVGISLRDGNVAATGVTYGGTALTLIGAQAGTGNQNRTEMWFLLAPPTGTASVVITMNQSKRVVGTAISFTGVNQTTPLGTFAGATNQSTNAAVTVTSAVGEVVLDTVTANGDALSLTVIAGQTQQWNTFSGIGDAGNARSGGSTRAGAAVVTMQWTLGVSKPWSIGAVSLKAGAASPPNVTLNKSVNPTGIQLPGTDLAYTVGFTNVGGSAAASVTITDAIPANTDFKVGSETHNLGTTGLTVAVAYSNNGGTTYAYTPVGGGGGAPAGYDRNVTNIRWIFTGSLSQTSPNNTGSVSFTSRIQ